MRKWRSIVYVCIAVMVLGTLVNSSVAQAQGTVEDQYKQMGAIAAIAEKCFQSYRIRLSLSSAMKKAVDANLDKSVVKAVFDLYDEAHEVGQKTQTVWNGTAKKYSDRPYDCSSKADMEIVQKFEEAIVGGLSK